MHGQGPYQIRVAEVLGDFDPEHEHVSRREEVGWLSLVGSAGIDVVIRSDRHVGLFDAIPIVVAEHHVERAVLVCLPPLECRGDVLAVRQLILVREPLLTAERVGSAQDQYRGQADRMKGVSQNRACTSNPTAHTTRGRDPGLHPTAHTTRGGDPGYWLFCPVV